MKYLKTLIALFILSSLTNGFTQSSQIDLSAFLDKSTDELLDIGYLHFVPQIEEQMDPKRAVSLEIYFGELDGSQNSKNRLAYIKQILDDDKAILEKFNRKPEVAIYSNNTASATNSKDFQEFLDGTGLENKNIDVNHFPSSIDAIVKGDVKKNSKRKPASFLSQRNFWTIIRGATSGGGVFAAALYVQGASLGMASTLMVLPALGSAGFIYWNAEVADFFVNGKWSKWLLTSEKPFAEKLRNTFGITPDRYLRDLIKNQDYIRAQYPSYYNENLELFKLGEEGITNNRQLREYHFKKTILNFKTAEKYFKWYITEAAFVAVAFKVPSVALGFSAAGSIVSMSTDVLVSAGLGFFAQGFGDLAIHTRKYQMINELKEDVISGKKVVDNKDFLLDEIEKVLAEDGKYKNYVIHEGSHKALKWIENLSRGKATFLSFFSVSGVFLNIMGIPGASAMLIGTGVGGIVYSKMVDNHVKIPFPSKNFKQLVTDIRTGGIKHYMRMIKIRQCEKGYLLRSLE